MTFFSETAALLNSADASSTSSTCRICFVAISPKLRVREAMVSSAVATRPALAITMIAAGSDSFQSSPTLRNNRDIKRLRP